MKQIMKVLTDNKRTTLSLWEWKEGNGWIKVISSRALIGENGIKKQREGDRKTPEGIFYIPFAFGIHENTELKIPYFKIQENSFWVDDINSTYYNRYVNCIEKKSSLFGSAEHLIENSKSYEWALVVSYNKNAIKGKGSGIFIHCLPTEGAGCIVTDRDTMQILVKHIEKNCLIFITEKKKLSRY